MIKKILSDRFSKIITSAHKDKLHLNVDGNIITVSVGCDLNHLDAEKIHTLIKNENPNYKICILHTCTAYRQFIQITKNVINAVYTSLPSDYKLVLTGCGAVKFQADYKDILIVEDTKKFDVSQYNIPKARNTAMTFSNKPLGLIQIQTGCNNQCSYCIFPKLKGHSSISNTKESILEDIKINIAAGIKNITLTGVNICQYSDPNDQTDLIGLLKYIVHQDLDINPISIYSIDPAYSKIFELIDYIEEEPAINKNLYLATQSGSNTVLAKMNRKHTAERVKQIINYTKTVNIRHDFIVGHPGETDTDFEESLQLLRLSQANEIAGGIAEFTAHEGTASYYMQDKVDPAIITDRYNRLNACLNNIIGLIKQEVKCIQFELWHNCTNECEFCYLNGCRKVFTEEQKQNAIKTTLEILNTDKPEGFNAAGLIGGELFGQQLSNPITRELFLQLIHKLKSFLNKDKMKEIWLTSNLLTDDLSPLISTLEILLKDLPKYQRVMLCTSYDTKGRFHSEVQYQQWYKNVTNLKAMFPKLCLHIQTICTQEFVDEWFKNKEKFIDFINKGFLMDFKPPATNAVDFIYYNTGLEAFRTNLEKFAKTQSYKYLIESREKFMQFWESVYHTFPDGLQKLRDFVTNKVKSECCYSVPWDEWFIERWDNDKENAPCGHCWDGFSYKNHPDKCCKCDVEGFIKMMEKK